MKFKHYKFPPQSYPPRISFKLMVNSELIMTDEATASLDNPISAELEELVTDQTDIIETLEKQAGTTNSE